MWVHSFFGNINAGDFGERVMNWVRMGLKIQENNMEDIQAIQKYLHDRIPLSKAMQLKVMHATRRKIVLSAPLAPNINHRATVFGGSSSAAAIVSAWALVHFRLQSEGLCCRVVIQKNKMTYEKPIHAEFYAICTLDDEDKWQKFVNAIAAKKRARIILGSMLECEGVRAGSFEGAFVATVC